MTNLNAILPPYIPNDEKLTNEIAEILKDVKAQSLKRKSDTEPFAFIKSIQGADPYDLKRKVLYNKDAIFKAIKYIKNSNYYCWYYCDYDSQVSIWVTRRNIQPHPWYDSI